MRWFPPAWFRAPAMFLLDPFEGPAVPTQGTYAVVYLVGRCLPLGGPRFTLDVEQSDRRLLMSLGRLHYRADDRRRPFGLESDLGEFRRDEVGICVGVNHGRADVAVAKQPL